MAFVKIEHFSFTYPNQNKRALDDVSLEIGEGEFVLLCGESGSGKSTLLRSLKPELRPYGACKGRILYSGTELSALDKRVSAAEIGFVMQNPETQPVTEKVWQELAFGLENLGLESSVIRRRVAEMASFFGIENWFRRDIFSLSGGQKQLLNLAAVMAMQPKLLILDEPTSQLDPIASREFLETVMRLNRELSLTVLLTEHRLESIFPTADKVAVLENGNLACFGTPDEVGRVLSGGTCGKSVVGALPTPLRVFCALGGGGKSPMTIREGRKWLTDRVGTPNVNSLPTSPKPPAEPKPSVECRDVWFRYGKNEEDVLRGVTVNAFAGELLCILGGNGSGKTTALSCIAGVLYPSRGKIDIMGRSIRDYKGGELYSHNIAMLPQNPQALFSLNTVREELLEPLGGLAEAQSGPLIARVANLLKINPLLEANPGDLSGGEQQKAALAKLLLLEPKILLLDEPTKGLDAGFKEQLGRIFKELTARGVCLVMVTHDLEFAASYADRCAMMFDGSVLSEDEPRRFFSGNSFYTTAANRMSRHLFRNAVTCGDVVKLCGLNEKQ